MAEYPTVTLPKFVSVDCYVFTRAELETLLLNARGQGEQEALRWHSYRA